MFIHKFAIQRRYDSQSAESSSSEGAVRLIQYQHSFAMQSVIESHWETKISKKNRRQKERRKKLRFWHSTIISRGIYMKPRNFAMPNDFVKLTRFAAEILSISTILYYRSSKRSTRCLIIQWIRK